MKKITLSLFALAISSTLSINAHTFIDKLLVAAKIDGAQQVPSITTNASGVAGLTLNNAHDTLCVNINFTGLTGAANGLHIHEAAIGVNGPVVFDLTPFITGNKVSAVITGSTLSQSFISKLLSGSYYINIHTVANPGGEIRGQLLLETDASYYTNLNGAQQVPVVTTTAVGVGVFTLSKHQGILKFSMVANGLSGAITGAHLHTGAIGVNGPVTIDLTSFITGNKIVGEVNTATMTTFISDLKAGNIYLNIHTAANPGGEIRSQLKWYNQSLSFDAYLNGAQQTPSISVAGIGQANIRLTTKFDTLYYDVLANGLSGAITGAHFHKAPTGSSGPVVVDITPNINGNRITGIVTGTALSTSFIGDLLEAHLYINLHTAANANGEIRGQVQSFIRHGHIIEMSGGQQVPAVTTSATGGGIVSTDRNQENAHYMFTVSGLTPTAAHFHSGAAATTGGVLYDLSAALVNNGAFGYLKNTDAVPFTSINSLNMNHSMVYLNVHTTANPNGELRGQTEGYYSCSAAPNGIKDNAKNNFVKIFPNPAKDNLTLVFENNESRNIEIVDITGKVVMSATSESFEYKMNVSSLLTGMYIVKVRSQSGNVSLNKMAKD